MQTVGWLVARKVSMPVVDQLKFVQIDSVDRLSGPFSRLFRFMQNPIQAGSKKNRRSFLKQRVVGVGAVGVGVGVGLPPTNLATQNGPQKPTKGDIAILTFLSALEELICHRIGRRSRPALPRTILRRSRSSTVICLCLANCYLTHDSSGFQLNVTMFHCIETCHRINSPGTASFAGYSAPRN